MTTADHIDTAFVPRRTSELAPVEIEGEIVAYQTAAGTIHVLNPSASLVWKMIDGTTDISCLASELSEAFDVAPEVMEQQVRSIVQEFGRQGLLEDVVADKETLRVTRLDLLRSTELGSEVREDGGDQDARDSIRYFAVPDNP